MASSATVGSAIIKLSFDGKGVKAELDGVSKNIEGAGRESGKAFGNAWSVAGGNLISKGVSKIVNAISSNMDTAIKRVDTLANSQKVFTAMGYTADSVSESMDTLNDYLDGLPTSMTTAVSAVQSLSASFGGIEKGTQAFIDMNNAGLAFGATSEQIEGAIQQLGQLSLDGPLDAQTWNSLRNNGFTPVFTAMAKEAGISVGQLKESFGKGELTVQDFLDRLHKLNVDGGGDMESLSELAKANTNGIGTAIENVQNRIVKAIAKIIGHIGQERISETINSISASFSGIADVVINIVDFLSNNQWILEVITAFFVGLLGMGIAAKVNSLFSALTAFATTNPVALGIGVISAGILLLMNHVDEIGAFFTEVFGGIASFITGVGQSIAGVFQNVWDFITGLFSNLADFFGNIFGGAWERVKAVFSTGGQIFMGIVDGITNAFRTIVNAIITGINHVVAIPFNAINGFLSFLKSVDILGIKPFDWVGTIDVPQIPLLAQGGVTDGATQAIIGEVGQEVVLPLENNTDNWAGLLAATLVDEMEAETVSTGVTIEKQEFIINNQLDAEDIGRVMMQSIRRAA